MFDFAVRQKAKFMRGLTYFGIVNSILLIYLSFKGFLWYEIASIVLLTIFTIWLIGHVDVKKNIQQKENEIMAEWNPALVSIQKSLKRIEDKA